MESKNWLDIAMQPSFRLVALLEETTEYDRFWTLPFHALSLCVRENPRDPLWVERHFHETLGNLSSRPHTSSRRGHSHHEPN